VAGADWRGAPACLGRRSHDPRELPDYEAPHGRVTRHERRCSLDRGIGSARADPSECWVDDERNGQGVSPQGFGPCLAGNPSARNLARKPRGCGASVNAGSGWHPRWAAHALDPIQTSSAPTRTVVVAVRPVPSPGGGPTGVQPDAVVDAVGDMGCAFNDPNYNAGDGVPSVTAPRNNCLQRYVSDLVVNPLPSTLWTWAITSRTPARSAIIRTSSTQRSDAPTRLPTRASATPNTTTAIQPHQASSLTSTASASSPGSKPAAAGTPRTY
jgi:hypothetical protein